MTRWLWGTLAGCAAIALPAAPGLARLPDAPQSRPQPAGTAACGDPAPLRSDLAALAKGFPGKAGVAVVRVGCGWVAGTRLDDKFPQQSVSKLWVAISVLDQVDRRRLVLADKVAFGQDDITLFHQPLAERIRAQGRFEMRVDQILHQSITASDNTANDRLLRLVGGPDGVRRVLASKRLEGIRFGPGERRLQSGIAGIEWRPQFAKAGAFQAARSNLPLARRREAMDRYLADPMDGATPRGIAGGLARLAHGELLSRPATDFLLGVMSKVRSGPRRLKGGVPAGWTVFHKTGTGQDLDGRTAGYNDVGIIQAPDGTRYAVAAMIGSTRQPIAARMRFMQSVSGAIVRHHLGSARGGSSRRAAR